MKQQNHVLHQPRATLRTGAFLGVLAFVLAAALPDARASHEYAIYKCSASYKVEYRHKDSNAPAPLDSRCSVFTVTSTFYLVKGQDGDNWSRIYINPRTKEYGLVENYPVVTCYDEGGWICRKGVIDDAFIDCSEDQIDIDDDGNDDADRCEILCLSGNYPEGGQRIPNNPNNFKVPTRFNGTYCRVTCYFGGADHYIEDNFGRRDYSFTGPFETDSLAMACVTGPVRCTFDRNLSVAWLNSANEDIDDGETAVTDFLDSRGYTSVGTRDAQNSGPFDSLSVEPFCP